MTTKTLYVGIDVSASENVICFLADNGILVEKILALPNNQPGAEKLEAKILAIVRGQKFAQVAIATEATSFYDFHLADYLASSPELATYQAEVYRFNPKLIHNFKKTWGEADKTDLVDARLIAERLRSGLRLPHPYHWQNQCAPLQRLSRFRFRLVVNIIQEKSFFLSHLFLKFSSYRKAKTLRRRLGATARAIIQEFFSPDELANTSLEKLTKFIVKAGKNRSPRPQEIAKTIKAMAQESYRLRPALAKSLNLIIASTLRNIRALQESLKEINQALADELAALPNTLCSVPGIGPVTAAGILGEVGNITRFKSQAALAKYAGLWWPRHQSGLFEAQERRLKKTGNKYLRYYLVEMANSLKTHNPEYRVFYQKKYREVRKHQHKRALVLTARKAVKLIYALLKNQQLYRQPVITTSF